MVKPQPATHKERCDQCLFSRRKIVPNERRREIVDQCLSKGQAFICHKTEDIVCKGFDDFAPYASNTQIVGKALGLWKEI